MSEPDTRGMIFLEPTLYADQAAWHAAAAELREDAPVLRVEVEGYTPFWAVTRHADVFAVSRDNEHYLNTRNPIVAPDLQFEFLKSIGIEGETLIHMDGDEHRDHRNVANDWFRPRRWPGARRRSTPSPTSSSTSSARWTARVTSPRTSPCPTPSG